MNGYFAEGVAKLPPSSLLIAYADKSIKWE